MLTRATVDYTAIDTSELLQELGDDASKWAAAFRQHAEKLGHHGMDDGWLIGWFANCIEHSGDVRRWRSLPSESPAFDHTKWPSTPASAGDHHE